MAQGAAERRAADHVAGQAHGAGVEAFFQHHAAAFGLAAHRFDGEVLAQHFAAAFMHHARGGTDVGVGIGAQVFLGEVDQARFALEQAQKLQGGIRRGHAQRLRRCGRRGRCWRGDWRGGRLRRVVDAGQAGGVVGVGQRAEKRADGDGNPAKKRRQWLSRIVHIVCSYRVSRDAASAASWRGVGWGRAWRGEIPSPGSPA